MATGDTSYNNEDFDSSVASEISTTASTRSSLERSQTETGDDSLFQQQSGRSKVEDNSRRFAGGISGRRSIPVAPNVQDETSVTSSTVRDEAFKEWKKRKAKMKKEGKPLPKPNQPSVTLPKKDEEDSYKTKCDEAVKEWKKRKSEAEKRGLKEEQDRKEKEEREKNERKERLLNSGQTLMKSWKESKEKVLKEERRKKLLEEKEEEEKRKQEALDNEEASIKLFAVWKEEKDKKLKDSYRRKKAAAEEAKRREEEQEIQRKKDAKEAHDAWKKAKAVSLGSTSTSSCNSSMTTTGDRPSWRPARSMQYDYPRNHKGNHDDTNNKTTTTTHKHQQQQHARSPSAAASLARTRVTSSGSRLKKKSVHVCCQVVEYWCSCDND